MVGGLSRDLVLGRLLLVGRLVAVSEPAFLQFARGHTDRRLSELLPSSLDIPTELHEAMRYSALAPGKRLRPALAMASALAVCGDGLVALDAGCAIEMVHCFSLIHDDLPAIDDDDLRRGLPTCHVKFGEAMAILAGDALFALAFEVCAAASSDLARSGLAVSCLAKATGSMGLVGGEVLDILAEGRGGDLEDLKTIHGRKTGSLIGASCEIGAILGGASVAEGKQFARFGESVGLAFQIADDVLNETSTPAQLGKAVGSDRQREKLTYPALMGLDEAKRFADDALDQALEYLDSLPGATLELQKLADYCVRRDW